MPSPKAILTLALLTFGLAGTAAAGACKTINSIQYCDAVDSITYTDIMHSGSYSDVVGMDPKTCACNKAPKAYSGAMAPLDEQVCTFSPVQFCYQCGGAVVVFNMVALLFLMRLGRVVYSMPLARPNHHPCAFKHTR